MFGMELLIFIDEFSPHRSPLLPWSSSRRGLWGPDQRRHYFTHRTHHFWDAVRTPWALNGEQWLSGDGDSAALKLKPIAAQPFLFARLTVLDIVGLSRTSPLDVSS
jgi:hypothetical protein